MSESKKGTQIDVHTKPPPRPENIPLRIYSNPVCPFAQRVRLIAAAKGVEAEEIQIHLKRQPQWYIDEINPTKQVPTIEHNGHIIRESLVAFDYVDDVFGEGSLWPKDPYLKAMSRLLVSDFGNKFTPNFYKHYGGRQEESNTKAVVDFLAGLEATLKANKDSGKGLNVYLGGTDTEKPSAVDYLLWPWLERLEALACSNEKLGSEVTKEKLPLFLDYIELMKQDPAVKKSLIPKEVYLDLIKAFVSGVHDYSLVDLQGTGLTVYSRKED